MESKFSIVTRRFQNPAPERRNSPDIPTVNPGKPDHQVLDIHASQLAVAGTDSADEAGFDERAPLIRRDRAAPTDAGTDAAKLLAPPGPAFFGHIPHDLFNMIAGFASAADIIAMSQVNTTWRGALNEPRRARPPVRILYDPATPVPVSAHGTLHALANQFAASLGDLPLRSRANAARLMHRGTLAGVLESRRSTLLAESKRRDTIANMVQTNISGVLGAGFYLYGAGLIANSLAWADVKPHGPAVWAYLASIFPSGLVSKYADAEAPGDSKQTARTHCTLMAAGVAGAAFKAISTLAFTVVASELATEAADGEAPHPTRYLPAVLMAGSALTDAALCGWATWHSRQAMQGKEMVVQIDQKIPMARATRAALTHAALGLRLTLTGIHEHIDIQVEEIVPGALAALAAPKGEK